MNEGWVEVRLRTTGGEARTLTYWPISDLSTLTNIVAHLGVSDLETGEGVNHIVSAQFVVDSRTAYFEISAE
jgi:hypothetical protein